MRKSIKASSNKFSSFGCYCLQHHFGSTVFNTIFLRPFSLLHTTSVHDERDKNFKFPLQRARIALRMLRVRWWMEKSIVFPPFALSAWKSFVGLLMVCVPSLRRCVEMEKRENLSLSLEWVWCMQNGNSLSTHCYWHFASLYRGWRWHLTFCVVSSVIINLRCAQSRRTYCTFRSDLIAFEWASIGSECIIVSTNSQCELLRDHLKVLHDRAIYANLCGKFRQTRKSFSLSKFYFLFIF